MATLEQFLRTGELGPIRIGMRQADIITVLGQPPDESIAREPKILKYGGLQLSFAKDAVEARQRLVQIGLYFGEPIPEVIRPADFIGTPEKTMADVRKFLDQAELKTAAVVEGEETSCIVLPSGVRITFSDQKLHSIMSSAKASARSKKQIAVSIPEDAWQHLSTLAKQSNRSVADLCAQWITQRANDLHESP